MKAIEIGEEMLWLESISKNLAFEYLMEPAEDIYSLANGELLIRVSQ
jgi:hypothetical protein